MLTKEIYSCLYWLSFYLFNIILQTRYFLCYLAFILLRISVASHSCTVE